MRLIDAINVGMRAISNHMITDEATPNVNAGIIKAIIEQHRRSLLASGWWFNQSVQEFTPTVDDKVIKVPANTLVVYSPDKTTRYGVRNGSLYEIKTQSTIFTERTKFLIVYDVAFEDLPEHAAQYLAYKSAAECYMNDLGRDENSLALEAIAVENFSKLYLESTRNLKLATISSRRSLRMRRKMNL